LLLDNYPDSLPHIVLNINGQPDQNSSQELQNVAKELLGTSMLFTLIAKAEELCAVVENTIDSKTNVKNIANEVEQKGDEPNDIIKKEKQDICQFFLQGKCRFGDKCHNVHSGAGNNVTQAKAEQKKIPEDETSLKTTKKKNKKKASSVEPENVKSPSKKVSMRTADDVVKRIRHDAALPSDSFIIGYLDRFIGIQEKAFSLFSWEDIASVDYHTFAIPKHRIQYFKYRDTIVWDKRERLDKVR